MKKIVKFEFSIYEFEHPTCAPKYGELV